MARGLRPGEYAPAHVKRMVAGRGAATKDEVARRVAKAWGMLRTGDRIKTAALATVLTPQIEAAMGQRLLVQAPADATSDSPLPSAAAPRASGTLESHYAPQAPLRLMDAKALQTALDVLGSEAKNIAVYARTPLQPQSSHLLLRRMPADAAATAQQLFAVLRDFDAQGARLIWVETVPESPEWDGVRDRLRRAAA